MKRPLLTVILIFIATLSTAAKEYIHISVKDGLRSDYITSLYRDSMGFMWIGTSEGVSRFDGISMKQYSLRDVDGKPSYGEVRSVVEYDSGEMILTSGKELYRYNRESDSFVFVMQADHLLDCSLLAKGYYFASSDLAKDENYMANNITLTNETYYPVVLGERATNVTVKSRGKVTDKGTGNTIIKLE